MITRPRSLNCDLVRRAAGGCRRPRRPCRRRRPPWSPWTLAAVWKRLSGATLTGKPGVPVGEGRVVLLHQQRGGHQDGDLLAVLHRLERGPHGDLGLAVADVAADQPVHRDDLLHVALDLARSAASWSGVSTKLNASSSSRCQVVSAEKAWPRVAWRAAYSLISSAAISRTALRARPLRLDQSRAAHLVQGRVLAADVAGDLVELSPSARTAGRPAGRAWTAAYSITRYSRTEPGDACAAPSRRTGRRRAGSCTTASPGVSSSGSIWFLRRAGILRVALSAAR